MGKHTSHICQVIDGAVLYVWGGLAFRDSGGIGSFDLLSTASSVMFLAGTAIAGHGIWRVVDAAKGC